MISVKRKNQKLCFVILLLLLSNIAPCEAAALTGNNKAIFDRFKGGSFKSSSSRFHEGNNANKNGDQVFGDEKRKVYTGPNPLHNR
ncbi:hypothetical protein MtrunA17_Chr7g0255921 [Medicago truncatula]|uniref:Clavata3/ESR (CLE) gene family member MtCLE07 n=1 Tax=Medicago truncatula TaxID=3880 RepID=A2Q4I8_MEDTR|nr:hypothetical protein MtrDRAFT_AC157502g23v2 [Medicago truncatula]AES81166.1 Clavata3/ESR (CLE) gene family member MtCLE07 [Medicago truncatula]RHN47710.1 hypothetical protein MtrunA17_Chr7g0255921 [Medicago truncatula]